MRTWAGSLIIGAYVAMAVTGLMMFFHLRIGIVGFAHKWLGWVLIFGGIMHIIVNRKSFVRYFRKPLSLTVIAVLILLAGSSMLASGEGIGRSQVSVLISSLEQSSLTTMAHVAHSNPQAVMDGLRTQGFEVTREQQTVGEIASANGRRSLDIMTSILDYASQASVDSDGR